MFKRLTKFARGLATCDHSTFQDFCQHCMSLLAGLERLNLSGNYISEVKPSVLASLTCLQELKIGSNLLTCLHLPVNPAGVSRKEQQKSDRGSALEVLQKTEPKAKIGTTELAIELTGWSSGLSLSFLFDSGSWIGSFVRITCCTVGCTARKLQTDVHTRRAIS